MIETKAECEAAAPVAGVPDATADGAVFSDPVWNRQNPDYNPPGCFGCCGAASTSLYFNDKLTSTFKSESFRPLCRVRHECATCAAATGACLSCDPATELLTDGQCRAVGGQPCKIDADCSSGNCGGCVEPRSVWDRYF